jgi:hypothetical protein
MPWGHLALRGDAARRAGHHLLLRDRYPQRGCEGTHDNSLTDGETGELLMIWGQDPHILRGGADYNARVMPKRTSTA